MSLMNGASFLAYMIGVALSLPFAVGYIELVKYLLPRIFPLGMWLIPFSIVVAFLSVGTMMAVFYAMVILKYITRGKK